MIFLADKKKQKPKGGRFSRGVQGHASPRKISKIALQIELFYSIQAI